MKKVILLIFIMFLLCACTKSNIDINAQNKYLDMIESIKDAEEFEEKNSCFSISTDISSGNNGEYRFYIIIDNAQIAMYDIEIVAIEINKDYSNEMAANAGIFEDTKYSMIPNQANTKDGYVKGISISGLTNDNSPTIYMLIQWKNKDRSETYKHFIKIDINGEE